jgi:hypothetical protein
MEKDGEVRRVLNYVLTHVVFNTSEFLQPDYKEKEMFARAVSKETGIRRENVIALVDEAFSHK